jgi:hypothetical protein
MIDPAVIELIYVPPTVREVIALASFDAMIRSGQTPQAEIWEAMVDFVSRRIAHPPISKEDLLNMPVQDFSKLFERIIKDSGQVPGILLESE